MKIGNIILFDCEWFSWAGFFKDLYILPTIRFDYLGRITRYSEKKIASYSKYSWTIDIIWLKLYITFGYVKEREL